MNKSHNQKNMIKKIRHIYQFFRLFFNCFCWLRTLSSNYKRRNNIACVSYVILSLELGDILFVQMYSISIIMNRYCHYYYYLVCRFVNNSNYYHQKIKYLLFFVLCIVPQLRKCVQKCR